MYDVDCDQINRHVAEEAKKVVEKVAQPFKEKGLAVKTGIVSGHKNPADGIYERAKRKMSTWYSSAAAD